MYEAPREMIDDSKRTKAGTLPLEPHSSGASIGGSNAVEYSGRGPAGFASRSAAKSWNTYGTNSASSQLVYDL